MIAPLMICLCVLAWSALVLKQADRYFAPEPIRVPEARYRPPIDVLL